MMDFEDVNKSGFLYRLLHFLYQNCAQLHFITDNIMW